MEIKQEPLKVIFEAYQKDGVIYVMIPTDKWMVIASPGKHIILSSLPELPSLK